MTLPTRNPKTAARWKEPSVPPVRRGAEMRVSLHDQVSGLITASLLLVGGITSLLFLVWLGNQIVIRPTAIPIREAALENNTGMSESPSGSGRNQVELEEPNPTELPASDPNPLVMLAAIGDVAQNVTALDGLESGGGPPGTDIRTPGHGPGDGTPAPDWEVRFQGTSLETYAEQLDFFGIELAVIGGGRKLVDYASRLTLPKPIARSTDGKAENRRYLLWRKGPLAEADRTLLTRAGIKTDGRIILQFVPHEIERQMAMLEALKAMGRNRAEIRKTVFAVEGGPGDYKFVVVDQQYRF